MKNGKEMSQIAKVAIQNQNICIISEVKIFLIIFIKF
jgi:hypothetical protein